MSAPAAAARRRALLAAPGIETATDLLWAANTLLQGAQAELAGLFVEDLQLLRLAALPFTREVGLASGTVRAFDLPDLERSLRAQAQQLRQLLAQTAQQLQAPWSFSIARGSLLEEALAAAAQADLILIGPRAGMLERSLARRAAPPAESTRAGRAPAQTAFSGAAPAEQTPSRRTSPGSALPGSAPLGAALTGSALLGATPLGATPLRATSTGTTSPGTTPGSTVAALFDASDAAFRALDAALLLAQGHAEAISLLLPAASEAEREHLRRLAAQRLRVPPQRTSVESLHRRDDSARGTKDEAAPTARPVRRRALVLAADAERRALESLVRGAACPLILVR